MWQDLIEIGVCLIRLSTGRARFIFGSVGFDGLFDIFVVIIVFELSLDLYPTGILDRISFGSHFELGLMICDNYND